MDPDNRGRLAATFLIGAIIALALPLAASAHSELEKASPANGSTVTGTPDEIVLTFSDPLNPTKSSIVLLDSNGTELGRAGVDPADDTVMRLTPPTLDAGAYEIDWTSAALDNDVQRNKVKFTVVAPTPSPTIEPTATASSIPSVAATASPVASPAASAIPPSPAPSGGSTTSGSAVDALLPVIVAIVLVAVLGGILLRRRSGGDTR